MAGLLELSLMESFSEPGTPGAWLPAALCDEVPGARKEAASSSSGLVARFFPVSTQGVSSSEVPSFSNESSDSDHSGTGGCECSFFGADFGRRSFVISWMSILLAVFPSAPALRYFPVAPCLGMYSITSLQSTHL